MFLFLLFYKKTFGGENEDYYSLGSFCFSKNGFFSITFESLGNLDNSYILSFCESNFFSVTDKCDNSTIERPGYSTIEHYEYEGTYFIYLTPLQRSSEEFSVVMKSGSFYNDYRENWLNLTQAILIILVLIVLIIYTKNASGHFKKLNFFPILAGIIFIGCQIVLVIDSLVRLFSNQTIFFFGLSSILRLGSYFFICITLGIYSGAGTFSGLETSCHRNTLLFFDVFFIIMYFINIGVFQYSFIPYIVQFIIYECAIITLSGVYRWMTKRDYKKTFDVEWPKEISSIATQSFILLSIVTILYGALILIQFLFDDFYFPKLIIGDLIFGLIIVITYILSNKRMDLIVLTQPLV